MTNKEHYFRNKHFIIDVSANSVAIFNIYGYLNRKINVIEQKQKQKVVLLTAVSKN
jgi:hypothetical protein